MNLIIHYRTIVSNFNLNKCLNSLNKYNKYNNRYFSLDQKEFNNISKKNNKKQPIFLHIPIHIHKEVQQTVKIP